MLLIPSATRLLYFPISFSLQLSNHVCVPTPRDLSCDQGGLLYLLAWQKLIKNGMASFLHLMLPIYHAEGLADCGETWQSPLCPL